MHVFWNKIDWLIDWFYAIYLSIEKMIFPKCQRSAFSQIYEQNQLINLGGN